MNVTVDHLGPCKKLLRVEVAAEKVNAAIDEVTGQIQKYVQLPGFRPGKAPRHLVVKSFETRISEDARRKLFQESLREAASKEKLNVIATLNVEEQQFGRGMPYSFTMTCEIAPEFTLPEYKGINVKREIAVPSDADVERALGILREQRVTYRDVERDVQSGDFVVANYRGTIEGKPITDFAPAARGVMEQEKRWLSIEKDFFVPGFTDPLIGAKAGETRKVRVTFPSSFVVTELANLKADYDVEVVAIKEKVLPEINDEFAAGYEASSVQDLIEGIRRDLQSELDFRQRRSVRDQLIGSLLKQVDCELPESVVSSETRNLVYNIVNENQKRGVAREVIEGSKDDIYKAANANAKDRVKAGFVIGRIAEKEGIKAEKPQLMARIASLAEENKVSVEKMVKMLEERNGLNEIANEIVTAKVFDFLELNAHIEDVPAGRP